jgi:hypothetical protein
LPPPERSSRFVSTLTIEITTTNTSDQLPGSAQLFRFELFDFVLDLIRRRLLAGDLKRLPDSPLRS